MNDEVLEILKLVTPTPMIENSLSNKQKINKIEYHMTKILEVLGLDLNDDSLTKTPNRIAKMYVNEIFKGLIPENFPDISTFENKMQVNQMIVVRDIKVMSCCEHHFVPFLGLAKVAYIPKDKIIGLSKINRVVNYFSRRPQVQERLTKQIADCLIQVLDTEDVAVFIDAKHYCVAMRGVEDVNSSTVTSDLRGAFLNSTTRQEFMTI